MSLDVRIRTIAPEAQRYPTVGDWPQGLEVAGAEVLVSALSDWREEACVAIHEFAEALLCRHEGITPEAVDAFDSTDINPKYEEHGDDPAAPYHQAHVTAGIIERTLALALGVDWTEYADHINAAFDRSVAAHEKE